MHSAQLGAYALTDNIIQAPSHATDGKLSLVGQVQCGLNLFLKMKNRAQMPALMAILKTVQPQVPPRYASFTTCTSRDSYPPWMVPL